ncbi:hypothetical protein [Haloarchaeobius iranensis]|uniref:Uncharacterized protein n=1 Tax=Haloarchaeobius iranensis TaxID=996166 RepID=A0A1G9VGH3_9EURY|nr:hypothetical protein [Haloarchaeobius iranensis]SDM71147.1 hypothetical protein SAMN05192554_10696 [Haloarchaeobius iranensis]
MSLEPVTSVVPPLRILLGVVAGVVATRGMDVVMARLPEGGTPPLVAAGVLTERSPDAAPGRLAAVVHHVAGWLTGPLFVTLLLLAEGVLGTGPVALAAATLVLFVLMVGFFVAVVLPRVGGFARQRVRQTGRDWAISAATYLVVLVPLVWATTELLTAL